MSDINKIVLSGRLTRDPELLYLNSGVAIIKFSLANNVYAGKEKGEYVNFIDAVMFGKRAEAVSPYLHKGDRVFVEGEARQERWEAQDGSKRARVNMIVANIVLTGQRASKEVSTAPPVTKTKEPAKTVKSADGFVDDIPF